MEHVRRSAQLMRDAGIGSVRIDFLWSDIEPEKGRFDFERYDSIVNTLVQHRLEILGLLHYSPMWGAGNWNAAPHAQDYQAYALAVVKHFKDRVHFWEIWNEPDHPTYWQPQDQLTAYSQLLRSTYPLLKNEDPDCRILMGGLSQAVQDSLEFIYRQVGRDHFDIVNIHPFVSPLEDNALAKLRQYYSDVYRIMVKYGDEQKPIWFTEIGCPGVEEEHSTPAWWLGKNPSEIQQAEWVRLVYSEALTWLNVEKIFWAFFRDTPGHFKDGVDYFGLVRNDFSLKAAYKTYQSLTGNPL
jgi:hypothetical protein